MENWRRKLGGIRITPADKWFSLCVRERAGWTCEYCGKDYSGERGHGLHCSHFFGRRHKATRHHPDNAFAHCYGCHQRLGANPYIFSEWARAHLGGGRITILHERHLQIWKKPKGYEKEIAAHYKAEYERMKALRDQGVTGRIEFTAFD